jgi:Domain of Unknown Function with PDB structure (DUF3857)/Transglutaminase-like superfamily
MTSLFRVSYRFLLLPLLLVLGAPWATAADWPPITPEEQAMTSIPEQPGAPAVILNREETDNDLLHFHSTYIRIKVLTEAGRQYADVQIPYDRHGGTINQVAGRTVHADGTVVPFEGKPLDKVIVKQHDLRYQVKSFTLPDVQIGSIIEYRYSFRYPDNEFIQPYWVMQRDLFQKKTFFKNTPYDFKRSNMSLILGNGQIATGSNWTSYMPKDHQPQLRTTPAAFWIDLQMDNIPAFVEEPFQQPATSLKWRVNFYYNSTSKVAEYWKDAGKSWNKRAESFMGHKNGVAEAVAQTVAATDTPEQKVRKIYAYVSKLENQSYIPYRAEKEEHTLGLKGNSGAEDVLRQRTGDHDDLSRLFVAMIRAAGIPAWLMWVPDRNENFFDDQYMNTEQLEAEIAIVQLDGKDVFLDPGTKFCPYGVVNWRYTGLRGLRQSADKGAEFGVSPGSDYKQAITVRMAHVVLNDQGTIAGTVAVAFYGIEAMNRRREGGRTDQEGRKKLLEDEIKSWLPGNSEITLTKNPDWDNTEQPLIAEFKISSPIAVSAGKRWLVSPHIFQVNDKATFPAAQRTNPVYFDYPSQEIDEVHVVMPPNTEIESLPPNDSVKLDYAIYQTQQKQETANSVFSRRDFINGGVLFPVAEYKTVKDFFDKVKAGDDQQIILKAAPHAAGN